MSKGVCHCAGGFYDFEIQSDDGFGCSYPP